MTKIKKQSIKKVRMYMKIYYGLLPRGRECVTIDKLFTTHILTEPTQPIKQMALRSSRDNSIITPENAERDFILLNKKVPRLHISPIYRKFGIGHGIFASFNFRKGLYFLNF